MSPLIFGELVWKGRSEDVELWMIKGMAISLSMTLFFELLFAVCWKVWGKREILLVILVNVLTNPIVVCSFYMNYKYQFMNLALLTMIMEVAAVVTEALLYKRFSKKVVHPWWFSIGINAFSYSIGELINRL